MDRFNPILLSKHLWQKIVCQLLERCQAITGTSPKLEIRQITEKDIGRLKGLFKPAYGRTFADDLNDQDAGLISILIAKRNRTPIGYSYISWAGARDPEVRRQVPDVPEFYRLLVIEPARSLGAGSALIEFIEAMALERGFSTMGLGVAHDNPRAAALYQRLGYREVVPEYFDRYTYQDSSGQLQHAADPCRFMVKDLTADVPSKIESRNV